MCADDTQCIHYNVGCGGMCAGVVVCVLVVNK